MPDRVGVPLKQVFCNMRNIVLCSDSPPNEQIAALRHFLMAGELVEPFEDIIDHHTDDDRSSVSFIQVCMIFTWYSVVDGLISVADLNAHVERVTKS